jgi:murein DD-endopeptidase MepM/ murein hydrolase activator NlpD
MPVAAVVALLVAGTGVAAAGGGGVNPPAPPQLSDVTCLQTCAGVRKATEGSKVQATGRHLRNVKQVLFDSGDGQIAVDPISTSRRSVKAKVPNGAKTGKPKVVDAYDGSSSSPKELEIVPPDQIPDDGGFDLKQAGATPNKAYFYGKKKPRVKYMFAGSGAVDVRIDIVKMKSGAVIDSFTEEGVQANTVATATWDGKKSSGKPANNGHYRFRIGPMSGGKVESTKEAKFQYYRFKFPVRGPHTYGDGVGAPRAGHTHQGQDVLAACGTKLVAARGGKVQWKDYQGSGAGNYIVIDGKKTDHDWAYMHLRKPSPLDKGDKVKTGEKIGNVGDTGDASGCHLHMEEWSGPGWYEGGNFLKSITKHLKKWDSWS